MPLKTLDAKDQASLLNGIIRGEYHLLLGAGTSIGARGGDGQELPNSRALAQDLLTAFGVEVNGEDIDLRGAYEAIEDLRDTRGRDRAQYLKYRFSKCQPTWHTVLPNIRWQRIWTLNIDDLVEQAYAKSKATDRPLARPYNWTSLYREPDREADEAQIVHLHGYAPDLEASEANIVFSIIEYLQASSGRHAWHRIFGDLFLQQPFIVVGAKLADEYDLAEFLRRGSNSQQLTGRPSFVVLRHIGTVQRKQFQKWGLTPLEAEAEAFFTDLIEASKKAEAQLASAIPGRPTTTLSKEPRIFLQQFQWLRADASVIEMADRDFYQGDEPTWADIIVNRDAQFEIVDRLTSEVRAEGIDDLAKPRQSVHCISGPIGSGKSTALLRIAREMLTGGFDVFTFRGEEHLDGKAVMWWLQRSPKCALFFDGLADFAGHVGRLAEECARTSTNLIVFATERDRRLSQVYQGITQEFLRAGKDHEMALLSDGDISTLLDKLEEMRRLGKLTRRVPNDRHMYFRRDAKRQLFVGMAGLEGGLGFMGRLKDEYLSVKSDMLRTVYALTCISYTFGYPLPVGIACAAAGISSMDLFREIRTGGQLEGIVRVEWRGLRPRHRMVAVMIIERVLDRSARFDLSLALAKALAPYVTTDTIRQRTLPYRIARSLMDSSTIFGWLGRVRVRDWYNQLVSEYSWNARFWEQRALAESELHDFPKARSFAEEALRLQKHPYTLNTLGTILVQMAIEHFEAGSEASSDTFWEGVEQLRESRRLGERKFEHPFITFFTHALHFARLTLKDHAIDRRLATEWTRWMTIAKQSQVFGHSENYQRLQEYQQQWLQFGVNVS